MKHRALIIFCILIPVLLLFPALTGCSFRQEKSNASPGLTDPAETAAPSPTPDKPVYTVVYRLDGTEIGREPVPEGECPVQIPASVGDRGLVAWKNTNGTETDVWNAHIAADTVFDAVTGPALDTLGGFFPAESDGLFHPYNDFTRSDAVRAIYGFMAEKPTGETFLKDVTTRARCYQAATTLVTQGYISLDEGGRFFPDMAITKADFSALLNRLFSPGAVRQVLEGVPEPMNRGQAAEVFAALLGISDVTAQPYYPDVAPGSAFYDAIRLCGQDSGVTWAEGGRANPGFLNLDGYLYSVGSDGYFLCDGMVGTLYFDRTGRFTTGDAQLDKYVADTVESQTGTTMTRAEMLRAVYVYVRDHYLYLKRNLYEIGATGWEVKEALTMFETGKGNCYNFTAAFWALARGVGYDAVAYSGLVGVDRNPHSWVEIDVDGQTYVFDVETEMQYRLQDDYYTNMYQMPPERSKLWSYAKVPYDD